MPRDEAAYQRQYRANNPDKVENARRKSAARDRALRRLATLHPDEFRKLYDEERAKEGLPPVRR
jgi:hypothetical protein